MNTPTKSKMKAPINAAPLPSLRNNKFAKWVKCGNLRVKGRFSLIKPLLSNYSVNFHCIYIISQNISKVNITKY